MIYRDRASFGKRIEYRIIAELLAANFDVFIPLVDDHGVDCVIKSIQNGSQSDYKEIQIKARSKNADCRSQGCFTVDNHIKKDKFYFIFYSEELNLKWCFTSEEFIQETKESNGSRTKGRRKITLFKKYKSKMDIVPKYGKYIIEDYSKLNLNSNYKQRTKSVK